MKTKKCKNCGNMILSDSRNCPYCFSEQDSQSHMVKCKNCGAKNIKGSIYCRTCGNKLDTN